MKHKTWIKFSMIFLGISVAGLQAGPPSVRPKNMPPPNVPQDDMADPFGGGDFNMEGPPSLEGPPEFPMEGKTALPKKVSQEGLPSGNLPMGGDFSDDFGPPLPDSGVQNDLSPLPEEQAPKGETLTPVKEEEPAPFSWSSIDLHNLAKQAGGRVDVSGRKVDAYRA